MAASFVSSLQSLVYDSRPVNGVVVQCLGLADRRGDGEIQKTKKCMQDRKSKASITRVTRKAGNKTEKRWPTDFAPENEYNVR